MFAVIDIPEFPLQALLRSEDGLRGAPLVLVEEQGRQSRVLRLNREAAERTVEPGMTVAQALARCPALQVRKASPEAERVAAAALFDAAYAFAARVEPGAPGLCTLDLQGLPPGNLEARGAALHAQLWQLGLWARIGFAPTPQLALFAARQASPLRIVDDRREFLDALPLALAGPSEPLRQVFQQWGLRTLGALLRLPRQDVAIRLGPEALALWDAAAATEPRPLSLALPPPAYEQQMDLEHPLETLEPLLFLLRRFLDPLCLRLGAAGLVAACLELELRLDSGPPHARSFRIPEPTCDAERLFRMLHAHLEQVKTDAPIVGLRLRIEPGDGHTRQQGLFETSLVNPHRFADTLAELTGICGPGRVGRPQPIDTHRPDAFTLERLPETLADPGQEMTADHGMGYLGDDPDTDAVDASGTVDADNILHIDFAWTAGGDAGTPASFCGRLGEPSLPPRDPPSRVAPPLPSCVGNAPPLRVGGLPPSSPASHSPIFSPFIGLPLRRLRPAQAVQVTLDASGVPLGIRGKLARGRIARAAGPWISSGDWWETRTAWQRSEWDIELQRGGLYRIYMSHDKWFIEGEYG